MAPTGGGNYRMQTRLSRFQNVPEMLRMHGTSFADGQDPPRNLDLPDTRVAAAAPTAGERPQTVVIAPSPQITAYLAELGERAEAVRSGAVAPEDDNMLKISTDGRKAALDMRLVTGERASTPATLDVAADNIAAIERDSRDRRYVDAAGDPSPTPGALQIVFCGPRHAARDVERLRRAARPACRAWVFRVRGCASSTRPQTTPTRRGCSPPLAAGHIAVLVGSTQKMGVGTNIQARAIALHHLGCTWRPADIEQRQRAGPVAPGQPERGGRESSVTSRRASPSIRTCGRPVERKARFISQIMRGRLDLRSIEDIGDSSLSFAEVKALASGDPLVLDKAQADAELDPRRAVAARLAAQSRRPHAHGHGRGRARRAAAASSRRSTPRSRSASTRAATRSR